MPEFLKTLEDFQQALKNAGGKVVVVDFTASWCPPCRMIAPKFEEFSKVYTNILFYKVDVDENSDASEDQSIEAMPTFKFYKDGKKIAMIRGADEATLKDKLKEYN